jgi:predicted metalloprotease with PDZ domain
MHYTLHAYDLNAHLFHLTLDLPASKQGTLLKLPVWIPGSYMVREFARHVVSISAQASGKPISVEQTHKNAWLVAASAAPRQVSYTVYAFDQSVRTAWLDEGRAFFNGSSLFLYSDATRHAPHHVTLEKPTDPRCKAWQLSTTLTPVNAAGNGIIGLNGFGSYSAANYDELIDKPVTMGSLHTLKFKAHGTPHEIVVTGMSGFDGKRLASDVKRICEAQIALFDPHKKQAPFKRYVFMLHASGDGYGGLEHRDNTALIARRADLPQAGANQLNDGYITLLGLFSHEYFHAWNVKRIKPAAFEPYDLERENLTRLLWLFEGFTSYYDDLMLLRAGLIDEVKYLKLLGKTFTTVLSMPGRQIESVANASYNAWTKYYRADENTPNSTISYYQKGSLVALALDALLRQETPHTLDDFMRLLYTRYLQGQSGVKEAELVALLQTLGLTRAQAAQFEALHITGTADAPWASIVSSLGYELQATADIAGGPATLGGRLEPLETGLLVTAVLTGGALQAAGLAKGDLIVAVNGEQSSRARWEAIRGLLSSTLPLTLHYFRDGLLKHTQLRLSTLGTKDWTLKRIAP